MSDGEALLWIAVTVVMLLFCAAGFWYAWDWQRDFRQRSERELSDMHERHERERKALDNYATACRSWIYGDGTKEAADKAYAEYLKVCYPKHQKAPRS